MNYIAQTKKQSQILVEILFYRKDVGKIFGFIILCLSLQVNASIFSGCGDYQLRGKLSKDLKDKLKLSYVVLEKTKGETIFHFENENEMSKILPFYNQFTEMVVVITKEMDGTSGIISSIKNIKLSVPNPLNMNSDFQKLTSVDCAK